MKMMTCFYTSSPTPALLLVRSELLGAITDTAQMQSCPSFVFCIVLHVYGTCVLRVCMHLPSFSEVRRAKMHEHHDCSTHLQLEFQVGDRTNDEANCPTPSSPCSKLVGETIAARLSFHVVSLLWCLATHACSPSKDLQKKLLDVGAAFNAGDFDWGLVKNAGLLNCALPECNANTASAGKILENALDKANAFRRKLGVDLRCFKIGVTANPVTRYAAYLEKGFTGMWLIATSSSVGLVHMLEAASILQLHQLSGCKNKAGTGGEGALNRPCKAPPPYFAYITGGRADQARWVG